MKNILLIVGIILLVVYAYIMVDTYIFVKKSENKRVEEVRNKLLKRINISMILTVILIIVIILRVVLFK